MNFKKYTLSVMLFSVSGKTQQSCSLSLSDLVHEIAASYDVNMGLKAYGTSSALFQLYTTGLENAAVTALAGISSLSRHVLALSVLFKNSTPGVRNVEFRIHFLVSNLVGNESLEVLCGYSSESAHFLLDGTQS